MKRLAAAGFVALAVPAAAADATFAVRVLTPETALKAAHAALEKCRAGGFQVTVAVVDRAGLPQALIRDRFAGAHTIEVATNKAWSSASFRIPTREIEAATRPNAAMAGLRQVPRVVAVGGGLPIEAGGSLVGAIGVSGAPGGENDEACAAAGVKAIAEDLEL